MIHIKNLLFLVLLIIPLVVGAVGTQNVRQNQYPWVALSVSEPLVHPNRLKQFQVYFAMHNDGIKPFDTKMVSWRLNINGKDHPNSQLLFFNGPKDERWQSLPAGEYLLFTYALGEWFKSPGTYKIMWKGDGFESPPVYFRVLALDKSQASEFNGTSLSVGP